MKRAERHPELTGPKVPDTAERLTANEVDAGLALVINMNHTAKTLCFRSHLGKLKNEL